MTTAYIATIGGHISELIELADRIPGAGDEVWITSPSKQTEDLMAAKRRMGHHVEIVPFIGERDLLGVARAVPHARRIYREFDVRRVVSTGSAIALGYLPLAAANGIETHYIESSTRVTSCSMTGRLLARTPGVQCWWQFSDPPPRFRAIGGVYDGFVATDAPTTGRIDRVVVTVGTTDRDFRRLIVRLTEILPPETEVLWQTGHSDVSGLDIDARRIVPEAELLNEISRADVVVSHAGAGSLAMALRLGRVPVFVPRRAVHGEQIDDHQVELADWAGRQGLAVTAEADELTYHDLLHAAGRRVSTRPVDELVLTGAEGR
ncbi:MAG: glycosyltransferase [Actinomycetota bacterium]